MKKYVKMIGGMLCLCWLWSTGAWAEQQVAAIDDNGVCRYDHGAGAPTKIGGAPLTVRLLELESDEQVYPDGVQLGAPCQRHFNAPPWGPRPFILIQSASADWQTTLAITTGRTYVTSLVSSQEGERPG